MGVDSPGPESMLTKFFEARELVSVTFDGADFQVYDPKTNTAVMFGGVNVKVQHARLWQAASQADPLSKSRGCGADRERALTPFFDEISQKTRSSAVVDGSLLA